jgi:hypothetical protein
MSEVILGIIVDVLGAVVAAVAAALVRRWLRPAVPAQYSDQ